MTVLLTSWPAATDPHGCRRVAFEPMTEADLDLVHEVEKTAYAHPWSRRHFADSLAGGHPSVMLLGYLVAMPGVDEVHLLNITVAPAHQRHGWARFLLDALVLWSRGQGAQWLWLEVRAGNVPARSLYEGYGFREVGLRRAYYPAGGLKREDAIVMSLDLEVPAQEKVA